MATTVDVLLEQQGLTVEEVASRSGMDAARVESIVCGRWLASPSERQSLAGAMGVNVTDISWGHSINPRNVRYHRFGLREDFSS